MALHSSCMEFKTIAELEAMGIYVSLTEEDHVVIRQQELVEPRLYNNKQLHLLARHLYPDKIVVPVVFHFDKDTVSTSWVLAQMELHKITIKDLVRQLPITKEELSAILNTKRALNPLEKGLFFYYFMCYKHNDLLPKDELTEKMHAEFAVRAEAEKRLIVFSALQDMEELNYSVAAVLALYNLTESDLEQYKDDYIRFRGN